MSGLLSALTVHNLLLSGALVFVLAAGVVECLCLGRDS